MRFARAVVMLLAVSACPKAAGVETDAGTGGAGGSSGLAPGGGGASNADEMDGGRGGGTTASGGGTTASGGGTTASGGGTTASGGGTTAAGGGTTAMGGGSATGGSGGGMTTAPDAGTSNTVVRFVAIGDTGHGNAAQAQVGTAIAAWCANVAHPCDFVVMLGDNIYDTGVTGPNDTTWADKFEVPYAPVNLPFWAALGNHDYGGNGAGTEKAKGQYQVDYANKPGQTKFKMLGKHYRFTAGHAEFFVTDTNEAFMADLPVYQFGFDDTVQRADLLQWTTQSTATWKIAMGHHPYKSNGPHGNAGVYDGVLTSGSGVKKLLDDRVCGKVDVYLSGHDHSNQWITSQCSGTELLVSGAASSTTTLTTTNATHFQTDMGGFIYIQLMGNTFTGTFVDAMGNQQYSRSFTK